jgi:hypothetical protein
MSALSADHEPGEATTNAPCHHLLPERFPSRSENGQDMFPTLLVKRLVFLTSRASSTGRSLKSPPRVFTRSVYLRAATSTLALPPWVQLPTRVHAHPCALDPSPEPAIRRSCRATCRLPTSAVGRPTSTPSSHPNPVASCGSKLPRARVVTSLAGHLQPDSHRPGGALRITRWRPPVATTARPTDLPQPDRSGHPLSRTGAEHHLEVGSAQRPCGYGLLRTSSPGTPPFRSACLLGPSYLFSQTKESRLDRTRGAFHRRSFRFPGKLPLLPRRFPGSVAAAQRLFYRS